MRRIKILYTIPNFETAGSGIALMKLVNGLDKSLFDPHIAVKHTRGKFYENFVSKSGIPIHVLDMTKPLVPIFPAIKNIFKVSRFLKREEFDIVYSYNWSSDIYEGIAARLAGCKYIYVKKNHSWYGYANKWWRIRTILAHHIASENHYIINEFYKNSPKVSFMPIGVDTNEFKPMAKDVDLLKELHIDDGYNIILFVANMVKLKNVETLIKATKIVNEKYPDKYKTIIVGGGDEDYINELKALTHSLALDNIVTFTGKRYDTVRFYSIADVFAVTTGGNNRTEAGPVVLLEAMASGVISLGTKGGGMLDRLSEFPDQLCSPSDESELADKLIKYCNIGQNEKSVIINKQIEVVCSLYSVAKEIQRHEQLYLSLMK